MVPVASPRLTPIGFRRDIKLFLAALVGFLVVIILTLLLLLLNMTGAAVEKTRNSWAAAADVVVDNLRPLPRSSSVQVVESQLDYIRGRYAVAAIMITPPSGEPIVSGVTRGDVRM